MSGARKSGRRTTQPIAAAWVMTLLALAAGVLGGACGAEDDDDGSCATVCTSASEACGGTTCLASCIASQAACNEAKTPETFSAWASCQPTLVCTGTSFTPTSCLTETLGLLKCGGSGTITMPSGTSGVTFAPDGGVVVTNPGRDGGVFSFDVSVPVQPGNDGGSLYTDSGTLGYDAGGGFGTDSGGETFPDAGSGFGDSGFGGFDSGFGGFGDSGSGADAGSGFGSDSGSGSGEDAGGFGSGDAGFGFGDAGF